MGESGYFDLTWASCDGNRISVLKTIPTATAITEDIIYKLLLELSGYLTNDIKPTEVREFAQRIINRFSQLTISSVAHWIYLIQNATPPFNKDLYGFDRRRLMGSLYQYLDLQKAFVDDRDKQTAETLSLSERGRLIGEVLKKNPEQFQKFKQLREKLESNHKDLSIYQTRSYKTK